MYRFARDQLVMNVAGVKIGGQPGENPTALCGTIFYQGHRIVEDEDRGRFDEKAAESLIVQQTELSEETGNPAVLHLYAKTPEAFGRYLDFVDGLWSGPLILDSADPMTRMGMAGLVSEIGYADRCIYNSISLGTTGNEEEALAKSEIDSALLLAYNPADSSVEGTIRALEKGGAGRKAGLIEIARGLGMNNLLIDPGVVPLGDGAGRSLRSTLLAKARFGLPAGSGIHNAVSSWRWLKSRDEGARNSCDAASAGLEILAGGDFVLYGPIERAGMVFPVAAMTDILVSEVAKDLEIWPAAGHPIGRLI
ncbi:tetrahydromethanopterin S-methyltransferase subunit H [Methanocrinis sp.]|uniref:tetrahydromethanopterin S-methyltransferase subunit H n=1 Tax=Methanocrinis sp. TaxID=3101522 RepID=UPI003D0FFFF6